MPEGSAVGSIFTTVGVSISRLRELGQVSKQLKTQLGTLGTALTAVGGKLQDVAKVRLPPGTILDQFGKPLVSRVQQSTTAISAFGMRVRQAGAGLHAFGATLSRTLGIALRWFLAYRIIRGVLGGIAKGFEDIKALEIEEIFTDFTFAGENATAILGKILPLSKKWGIDIITTYRAVLQFGRALGDMYEMDLPQALALTDVAMKLTVASGQNLNESISNLVGYIRILGLESIKDVEKFMSILYAAAYRTNEALTKSGQAIKGGALAMDTLTDAVQRMLPSMTRFGLSWEQIAAIASIFITNLDEAGQGIGAYTAKLFEAIKGNQQLKEVYEDVGVELTRHSEQLIPALVEGYRKMTHAQRDEASAATRVGIGAHIVATFWESLTQIQERALDIKNKSNLLDMTAIRMMDTLQKKQDQLKISMQALNIQVMRTTLPAWKGLTEVLTNFTQAIEWTGESIGITFFEMIEGTKLTLRALSAGWRGQVDELEEVEKAAKRLRGVVDEELGDAYQKVFGLNEELIGQYMDMQLQLQRMFVAKKYGPGVTADDILILEDAKRIMQEYSAQIKIAVNNLGAYASKQEIAGSKTEILRAELAKLEKMLERLHGLARLQVEVRVSAIVKELQEIEKLQRDYGRELLQSQKYRLMEIRGIKEIFIIEEKIRDLEIEKNRLKEQGLKFGEIQNELNDLILEKDIAIESEIADIYNRLEDIAATGLMGVIEGTKTWRNILEDIGQYTVKEIIKGLIEASLIGETLRGMGGSIWNILSSIASLGGKTVPKTPTVTTAPVWAHEGGFIKDLKNVPRYQFGGEVLGLLKPGEYVVSEGPAQKYKGLLEAINAGKDVGGAQSITYNIYAVDPRSFAQMLYGNKASVHRIVQEAQRFRVSGFRGGEG